MWISEKGDLLFSETPTQDQGGFGFELWAAGFSHIEVEAQGLRD